jgi:hypothetical protein
MARFITGALPQDDCARARTTTPEAGVDSATLLVAVADERNTRAIPPDALESLTVPPADAGFTFIVSASMEVESAAVATGVEDIVITHAATIATLAMKASTPRRARIGDSAS